MGSHRARWSAVQLLANSRSAGGRGRASRARRRRRRTDSATTTAAALSTSQNEQSAPESGELLETARFPGAVSSGHRNTMVVCVRVIGGCGGEEREGQGSV